MKVDYDLERFLEGIEYESNIILQDILGTRRYLLEKFQERRLFVSERKTLKIIRLCEELREQKGMIRVESVGFDRRILGILERIGVFYVWQLSSISKDDFLAVRNAGNRSLKKVNRYLNSIGMKEIN